MNALLLIFLLATPAILAISLWMMLSIDNELLKENSRLKKENTSLQHTLKEHLEMQDLSLKAYRAAAQNLHANMAPPVQECEHEEVL